MYIVSSAVAYTAAAAAALSMDGASASAALAGLWPTRRETFSELTRLLAADVAECTLTQVQANLSSHWLTDVCGKKCNSDFTQCKEQ